MTSPPDPTRTAPDGNRSAGSCDREVVDCGSWREVISAQLDGATTAAEDAALAAHLAGCPACAGHAGDLARLHRRLRVRPAEPVPDRAETILAAVVPVWRPRRRRVVTGLAAAAALAVVGVAAAVLTGGTGGTGAPPMLAVRDARVWPAPAGGMSVLTFTIDNRGGADDALVDVATDAARQVDLHTVRASVMRSVDEVVLSAGAAKRFAPTSSHVMLIDTTEALTPGAVVDVELRFALSPPITVRVPVAA